MNEPYEMRNYGMVLDECRQCGQPGRVLRYDRGTQGRGGATLYTYSAVCTTALCRNAGTVEHVSTTACMVDWNRQQRCR